VAVASSPTAPPRYDLPGALYERQAGPIAGAGVGRLPVPPYLAVAK
jgi:hypothetical protein